MAYETDLLEFSDIFEGSKVLKEKVKLLKKSANSQLKKIDEIGGLVQAIENGFLKSQLVESQTSRQKKIESGDQKVVGVNCFAEGENSPLVNQKDGGFMKVNDKAEKLQIKNVIEWKEKRNNKKVLESLKNLKEAAVNGDNIMQINS